MPTTSSSLSSLPYRPLSQCLPSIHSHLLLPHLLPSLPLPLPVLTHYRNHHLRNPHHLHCHFPLLPPSLTEPGVSVLGNCLTTHPSPSLLNFQGRPHAS